MHFLLGLFSELLFFNLSALALLLVVFEVAFKLRVSYSRAGSKTTPTTSKRARAERLKKSNSEKRPKRKCIKKRKSTK
jgi:hypothetical protein